MSGGHYDYKHHHIQDMVELIKADLYNPEFDRPEHVKARMRILAHHLKKYADVCHSLEWYLSGDWGEEDFLEAFETLGLRGEDGFHQQQ